ncbi:Uncharacterised protein [Mycobacteroides abscessus subsp. abscessus]|nr:Uncharacterised protein [Mycobacteroides abscessus subsp. abscessus]
MTIAVSTRCASSMRCESPSATAAERGVIPATATAHRGAADSTANAAAVAATPVLVSGTGHMLAAALAIIIGAENATAATDTRDTPARRRTRATANAVADPRRAFGAAGPPGTAENPAAKASTTVAAGHAASADRHDTISAASTPPQLNAAAAMWSPWRADQIKITAATVTAHNTSAAPTR